MWFWRVIDDERIIKNDFRSLSLKRSMEEEFTMKKDLELERRNISYNCCWIETICHNERILVYPANMNILSSSLLKSCWKSDRINQFFCPGLFLGHLHWMRFNGNIYTINICILSIEMRTAIFPVEERERSHGNSASTVDGSSAVVFP